MNNMNIEYKLEENPVAGVSLIKHLSLTVPMPMNMDEIVVKPHCKTPVDQHAVVELWQVLSGEGQLTYQDKVYLLKAGDRYFFHSYETHQVENIRDEDLKILSIYWRV